MYTEVPVLRRCCFCLPLRPGLIAWVYVKMVTNMLFLGLLSYYLHHILPLTWFLEGSNMLLCLMIFYTLLDTIFGVLFLVSAHLKKHKMMKIYFKYCVVMLILYILSALFLLFYVAVVTGHISDKYLAEFVLSYLGSILMILFEMFLLVYIILLVRSEILKLEINLERRLDRATVTSDNSETTKETHTAFSNRLANGSELIIVHN